MVSNNDVTAALARVVKSHLKASGITQREASERTGIPQVTLTRRLGGHSPFAIDELYRLSQLVDRAPSALVAEAEDVARTGDAA